MKFCKRPNSSSLPRVADWISNLSALLFIVWTTFSNDARSTFWSNSVIKRLKSCTSTFLPISSVRSDLLSFRCRACATDDLLALSFNYSSISAKRFSNYPRSGEGGEGWCLIFRSGYIWRFMWATFSSNNLFIRLISLSNCSCWGLNLNWLTCST